MRQKILMNTDGSCIGNPGPGGFACIYEKHGKERIVQGRAYNATNNKMELIAAIRGLMDLTEPSDVTIRSDSTYIMVTPELWMKWQKKKTIPNKKLWEKYFDVIKKGGHTVSYLHVDGHTGDEMNERCDKYARAQAVRAMHEAYERGMFDA